MKTQELVAGVGLCLSLLFTACAKDDSTDDTADSADTDTDTDTDTGADMGHSTAVVTTVSADYTTGSFASIDLASMNSSDELFVTSGDPVVVSDDGLVFQINRFGHDSVRAYEPGSWVAPLWEQSMGEYSNPYDVEVCGGDLFVALYAKDYLAVVDVNTGATKGSVDLSAFHDSDGLSPEASSLVEANGKLYVAMNRLDTTQTYWSSEGSAVAEVDCATLAVTQSWYIGGNANVMAWPDSDKLLVGAEAYGEDSGGLYILDPAANTVSPLDGTAGKTVGSAAAYGTKAIVTSVAPDWSSYGVHCVDLVDGTMDVIAEGPSYLTGAFANNIGQAFVTAGSSWLDEAAPSGIFVYDIASCAAVSTEWMGLSMYPSSVAFY